MILSLSETRINNAVCVSGEVASEENGVGQPLEGHHAGDGLDADHVPVGRVSTHIHGNASLTENPGVRSSRLSEAVKLPVGRWERHVLDDATPRPGSGVKAPGWRVE
jgi:hypothetical protein